MGEIGIVKKRRWGETPSWRRRIVWSRLVTYLVFVILLLGVAIS